jgi:phosphoglycolate phosphatase-like HAD superfamily hydrolase
MEHDIAKALHSLAPTAQWSLIGTDYENLNWINGNGYEMPTKEEVEEEIQRLQEEYEYNQYQRDRKNEYPSIEDQLDLLYHQGYEGWKQEIDRVKEMHPKPNS